MITEEIIKEPKWISEYEKYKKIKLDPILRSDDMCVTRSYSSHPSYSNLPAENIDSRVIAGDPLILGSNIITIYTIEGAIENLSILLEAYKRQAPGRLNESIKHKTTQEGYTALHFAAMSENKKMWDLLVQHGADENAESSDGVTPLSIKDELETYRKLLVERMEKNDSLEPNNNNYHANRVSQEENSRLNYR